MCKLTSKHQLNWLLFCNLTKFFEPQPKDLCSHPPIFQYSEKKYFLVEGYLVTTNFPNFPLQILSRGLMCFQLHCKQQKPYFFGCAPQIIKKGYLSFFGVTLHFYGSTGKPLFAVKGFLVALFLYTSLHKSPEPILTWSIVLSFNHFDFFI